MTREAWAMKVTVVAEAGVNHNGDHRLAFELIEMAASCGADYVKFQSFKASKLVTQAAGKAVYQEQNCGSGSQYEMLKALELSPELHLQLKQHCSRSGIGFLSTPFDEESATMLAELGVDLLKIPSGEVVNLPFLQHIGALGLPTVMSTGMATLDEVKAAVRVLLDSGVRERDLTVLHCNTEYPTPMKDANLLAIRTLRRELGLKIGYSDHTSGINAALGAVALGACFIEKHVTLDRTLPGPDHQASLEPTEFKALVEGVRELELALGDGEKSPTPSEFKNRDAVRRSIHIATALPAGHRLTPADLVMKRPGDGICPMRSPEVVGRQCRVALQADQKLAFEDLS